MNSHEFTNKWWLNSQCPFGFYIYQFICKKWCFISLISICCVLTSDSKCVYLLGQDQPCASFSLWGAFSPPCSQVLLVSAVASVCSVCTGKWWMPITGRGGSPTTCTGSSAKTPASSTWNKQWTCGSTRIDQSLISSPQTRRLLPMHNEVLKRNMLVIIHLCAWTAELRDGRMPCGTFTRSSIHGNIP